MRVWTIAKNTFALFAGELSTRIIGFFVTVYLARILLVTGFGWLNFAHAFLIYLLALVDVGFSVYGAREVAKNRSALASLLPNILVLRTLFAGATFILSGLFIFFLPLTLTVKLLFIGTFLLVFQRAFLLEWVFQGIERMEFIGFSRALYKLLFLLLVLWLIKSPQNLVLVPYLDFAGSFTVALLTIWLIARKFQPWPWTIDPLVWPGLLKAAWPLGLTLLFSEFYYNLDMIMLGVIKDAEAVGWYSAAYKIFWIIFGFFLLWQAAVFPVVSSYLAKSREQAGAFLDKYLRLTVWTLVPVVGFVLYTAPEMIFLIFGPGYGPSAAALQILILTLGLTVASGLFGQLILVAADRQRQFLFSMVIGTIFNFLANLILIPSYGYLGAATATLISEILMVALLYYFARDVLRLSVGPWFWGPFFGAGLAMAGCFFVFPDLSSGSLFGLIFKALFFSGVYLLATVVFGGERKFILSFLAKILKGQREMLIDLEQ